MSEKYTPELFLQDFFDAKYIYDENRDFEATARKCFVISEFYDQMFRYRKCESPDPYSIFENLQEDITESRPKSDSFSKDKEPLEKGQTPISKSNTVAVSATAASAETSGGSHATKEPVLECPVCLDFKSKISALPCGHVVCNECEPILLNACAFCRKTYVRAIPLFF